jgi:hypothetical protein
MKIKSIFKTVLHIFFHRDTTPVNTTVLQNVKQLHQPAKIIYMYKREIAGIKK